MKSNLGTAVLIGTVSLALAASAQQDFRQQQNFRQKDDQSNFLREGGSITLPDAPQAQSAPVNFWAFGSFDRPLRGNHAIFHDKTWIAVQSAWLGAIVYDVELTHQGLSHHNCVEKNMVNNPHPSRAQLYRSDLPAYAVGTAFNLFMLKYVTKPLIFEIPGYSSVQHIRGGSEWLMNCWD